DLSQGDAFRALLWFSDALQREGSNAQAEAPHRERIAAALQQFPDLLEVRSFAQPVIQTRMVAGTAWAVTTSADSAVHVWDVTPGEPVCPALKHDGDVKIAVFDQDGRHLATATGNGTVNLWDLPSGHVAQAAVRLGQPVQRMVFVSGKSAL